jgi:DNA-binding GntR family transcriptional regulator
VKIDPGSPDHPYVQLAALLRARIASGQIVSVLPSIMDLTEETGLSVGTVRRAVKLLVEEGLVRTIPGRGTFVAGRESGTPPPVA